MRKHTAVFPNFLIFFTCAAFGQDGRQMQHVTVNDVELAYEIIGEGEPVLLIHGGWLGDAFVPMLDEPALDGYMLINYHRRGYGRSSGYEGETSYKQQASDALGLMAELDIPKAHLVGHSFGGGIALQMAMDSPDAVATLVLLEGVMPRIVEVEIRGVRQASPPGLTPEEFGNEVMSDIVGEDWQELLKPMIPDVSDQVARGATTMAQDRQMGSDRATPEEYSRIQHPVIWVSGGQPGRRVSYVPDELSSVVPHLQLEEIPGVGHAFQMAYPEPVAEFIASWLEDHPIQRSE